jgi:AraC-like DNA-binding protein
MVGESPARYLARWRAQTAADLLRRRPEPANAELARLVGYDSEDAFARAFKRYVGRTPGELRLVSAPASHG